jgi:hypothetical protein
MLLACMLFHVYLKKRSLIWLRFLLCAALLFVLSILIYPLFHGENLWFSCFWYGLIYLTMVAVSRFCCDISWQDAIYCASCGYLVQHLASSVFILCIFNGSIPVWNGPVYYIVYLLVYALVFFTFARLLPDEGEYHVSWLTASMTSVVALSIVLLLSTYVKTTAPLTGDIASSEKYILLLKGSQVYAASICLVILILQVVQRRELRTQRMLDRNQNLWKQRQMQYQLQKENIDLINRKCHDLKHQISALRHQSEADQEKSIAELEQAILLYDNLAKTGNDDLDIVLAEKMFLAEKRGVKLQCIVDGGRFSFMRTEDICSLFGNAIDNAIEAAAKEPIAEKRIVMLHTAAKGNMLSLHVENPCFEKPQFADGLPLTTKNDTDYHGFGMRSMRYVAEKYGGVLTAAWEDGIFSLDVLFLQN